MFRRADAGSVKALKIWKRDNFQAQIGTMTRKSKKSLTKPAHQAKTQKPSQSQISLEKENSSKMTKNSPKVTKNSENMEQKEFSLERMLASEQYASFAHSMMNLNDGDGKDSVARQLFEYMIYRKCSKKIGKIFFKWANF